MLIPKQQSRLPCRLWLTALLLASELAMLEGCSSKRALVTPPQDRPASTPEAVLSPTSPPPAPRPAAVAMPPTEAELFERMSLAELNATTPLGDAYFKYDSSELTEPTRAMLQTNADWLRK